MRWDDGMEDGPRCCNVGWRDGDGRPVPRDHAILAHHIRQQQSAAGSRLMLTSAHFLELPGTNMGRAARYPLASYM